MSADLGFRTDFFGDRKCLLKKVVQKYAQAMVVLGSFHCLFHLADDLGFAQHHRIQARGYSEGVASGVVI